MTKTHGLRHALYQGTTSVVPLRRLFLSSRATRSFAQRTTEWSRDLLFPANMRVIPIVLLLLALCACKVGPNYKRPKLNVPDQYRSAPSSPAACAATSLPR